MKRFDDLIMWGDMKAGPRAVPGRYRVRLKVGDMTQEAEFDVHQDPRSHSTSADYQAQFAFVMETSDLLSRTHTEIKRIRVMREQLQGLQTRLISTATLTAEDSHLDETITTLLDAMTAVEEALYQTKNESQQDPLNDPIRLNDKLSSLMRGVSAGDAKPTDQAHAVKAELTTAVKAELTTAIKARLDDLTVLWTKDLPALQVQVNTLGLSLLVLPELDAAPSELQTQNSKHTRN
jgi:hypothetical protein